MNGLHRLWWCKKRMEVIGYIDYRKLNARVKFDAYPMPLVDEMLDAVGQS